MSKAYGRITSLDALKDLRWFSCLFGAVVGAPSILSIIQMVRSGRLIDGFQWIVDGYNHLVALMAAVIEPFITPVVARLNDLFGWHLTLYPHWRPLFVIGMVFVGAWVRAAWRYPVPIPSDPDPSDPEVEFARRQRFHQRFRTGIMALGLLLGALLAGLVPLTGAWWQQAIIASLPVVTTALSRFIAALVARPRRSLVPDFPFFQLRGFGFSFLAPLRFRSCPTSFPHQGLRFWVA